MLTIAVLTGHRPALLSATLEAMASRQAGIWGTATRVVVHNGADPATSEVLDRYQWHHRTVLEGRLRSIAEASQYLMQLVADADQPYVMRLEDDWEADETVWWDDAVGLLEECGQVRLRKADEPVMTDHRITGRPIRWQDTTNGHRWAPSAHFTHNPTLMRTWDLIALAGYTDEVDAARRMVDAGWASAQHQPGVFRHLGAGRLSLKRNGGRS